MPKHTVHKLVYAPHPTDFNSKLNTEIAKGWKKNEATFYAGNFFCANLTADADYIMFQVPSNVLKRAQQIYTQRFVEIGSILGTRETAQPKPIPDGEVVKLRLSNECEFEHFGATYELAASVDGPAELYVIDRRRPRDSVRDLVFVGFQIANQS